MKEISKLGSEIIEQKWQAFHLIAEQVDDLRKKYSKIRGLKNLNATEIQATHNHLLHYNNQYKELWNIRDYLLQIEGKNFQELQELAQEIQHLKKYSELIKKYGSAIQVFDININISETIAEIAAFGNEIIEQKWQALHLIAEQIEELRTNYNKVNPNATQTQIHNHLVKHDEQYEKLWDLHNNILEIKDKNCNKELIENIINAGNRTKNNKKMRKLGLSLITLGMLLAAAIGLHIVTGGLSSAVILGMKITSTASLTTGGIITAKTYNKTDFYRNLLKDEKNKEDNENKDSQTKALSHL